MKYSFLLLFLPVLLSRCGNPEPKPINANTVIKSAEILTYAEISDSIKGNTSLKNGCYCHPTNWNEFSHFENEKAFFVRMSVDNKLLAELTESETFSKEMLFETDGSLYGRYHNRWKCLDDYGTPICENDKGDGFQTLHFVRRGDTDEIIIGPMREKPRKLVIEISDSKNYPDATPEYVFNN